MPPGWFSYTLADPLGAAHLLRLTFAVPAADDERRHEVRPGGRVLGEPSATRAQQGVLHVDHVLDGASRTSDGRLVVSVHALDGMPTADLLRVRLVGRGGGD